MLMQRESLARPTCSCRRSPRRRLGEVTHEAKAGDQPITIVDLRGHFAGSGMTPPFAGIRRREPGGRRAAHAELPAGHPPIGTNSGGLPPGHPDIGNATAPLPSAQPNPLPPIADVATRNSPPPPIGSRCPPMDFAKRHSRRRREHGAIVTLINFPATKGR